MRYSVHPGSGRCANPKTLDDKNRADADADREPNEQRISDNSRVPIRHYQQQHESRHRDEQENATDHDRKKVAPLAGGDRPFPPFHACIPQSPVLTGTTTSPDQPGIGRIRSPLTVPPRARLTSPVLGGRLAGIVAKPGLPAYWRFPLRSLPGSRCA
jgi:hypothetical protein